MNLLLIIMVTLSLNAFAGNPVTERSVTLPVDISESNFRLYAEGYGTHVLKIFIPALSKVTFLNHRADGAKAPSLSTYDTENHDVIVQNREVVENVKFKISLYKDYYVHKNSCTPQMVEVISANIRGFNFKQMEVHDLPKRHVDDCR